MPKDEARAVHLYQQALALGSLEGEVRLGPQSLSSQMVHSLI